MSSSVKKVMYYNMDEKFLTPYISKVESLVSSIEQIQIEKTDTIRGQKADLIIVSSPLGGEELIKWIQRLIADYNQNGSSSLIPIIFVTDTEFSELEPMIWQCISQTNWYFDIVNRDNLEFLPMRIALLLKISDHIKEIEEYDRKITELSNKVSSLENSLNIHGV